MNVTWLSIMVALGFVLILVVIASLAGFVVARRHSRRTKGGYFWDDESRPR